MVLPPSTPNGYERIIPKGRGQENTTTTAKPMRMLIPTNYKEANKSPGRGGNNCGSIKPHGKNYRRFPQKYTGTRKKWKDSQERR